MSTTSLEEITRLIALATDANLSSRADLALLSRGEVMALLGFLRELPALRSEVERLRGHVLNACGPGWEGAEADELRAYLREALGVKA